MWTHCFRWIHPRGWTSKFLLVSHDRRKCCHEVLCLSLHMCKYFPREVVRFLSHRDAHFKFYQTMLNCPLKGPTNMQSHQQCTRVTISIILTNTGCCQTWIFLPTAVPFSVCIWSTLPLWACSRPPVLFCSWFLHQPDLSLGSLAT